MIEVYAAVALYALMQREGYQGVPASITCADAVHYAKELHKHVEEIKIKEDKDDISSNGANRCCSNTWCECASFPIIDPAADYRIDFAPPKEGEGQAPIQTAPPEVDEGWNQISARL